MDHEERKPAGDDLQRESWPCVWMTAGVVAYKLCDRGFDCDRCPLDIGLRGARWPADLAEEEEPQPCPGEPVFPDDRLYHPSHMWAQPVDGARVRCGLDAFAATLLGRAVTLVLPAPLTTVRQGLAGFWLSGGDHPVPLLSPVSGRVVRRNGAARRHPRLVIESAYDRGWLVEVECPDWEIERRALIDAARMTGRSRRQLALMRRKVSRFVNAHSPSVGRTMADGGRQITELRELLGEDRHRRLALSLLG